MARRAQGLPPHQDIPKAGESCSILVLPLGCSSGRNPPSCPSAAGFLCQCSNLEKFGNSQGDRAHLCSQRSGHPASPIHPSCSQQNPARVQETVGTPEGRKGFWLHFHFAQNTALLTSEGDCPPPARWMLPGLCREWEQNPTKATLLQQKQGVPFVGALPRGPGLLASMPSSVMSSPILLIQTEKYSKSFGCFTLPSPPSGKCRKKGEGSARKIFQSPHLSPVLLLEPPSHPSCMERWHQDLRLPPVPSLVQQHLPLPWMHQWRCRGCCGGHSPECSWGATLCSCGGHKKGHSGSLFH